MQSPRVRPSVVVAAGVVVGLVIAFMVIYPWTIEVVATATGLIAAITAALALGARSQ